MKLTLALLASVSANVALAQVGGYGQCGGTGYSGSTTCRDMEIPNGVHMLTSETSFSLDYSQCLPSTGACAGGSSGGAPTTLKTSTKSKCRSVLPATSISSTRGLTTKAVATTTAKPLTSTNIITPPTSTKAATTTAASAAPPAQSSTCGQWSGFTSGAYSITQDLWGESAATSGSQCSTFNGAVSSGGVAWTTTWTWAGASNQVKSYAHAALTFTPKLISSIQTMPSTFDWSYTGSGVGNIVADVSYDLFTSSTANSAASGGDYEVMIWLGYYGGAGPISSTGKPIATPTIAGHAWNLYYGLNGSMKVYSFLSAVNPLTTFSGDVKAFYTYLQQSQGYPASSQYLNTFQAGTEPFTGGPATLSISQWSAAVN
ncbi:hypothetical protein MMC25_006338 [Agyrium rufum]|nr:hypothetical protein [Agyrium rufum]